MIGRRDAMIRATKVCQTFLGRAVTSTLGMVQKGDMPSARKRKHHMKNVLYSVFAQQLLYELFPTYRDNIHLRNKAWSENLKKNPDLADPTKRFHGALTRDFCSLQEGGPLPVISTPLLVYMFENVPSILTFCITRHE